ncbi:MAG: hypothetical protein ACXVED_19435, partial [Bacteroidia bacterium]
MRKYLILFSLLFLYLSLSSANLDSLISFYYKNKPQDTAGVNTLNQIAKLFGEKGNDSILFYAQKALTI